MEATTAPRPIRTSTCPDPTCPWTLDIYGAEDELVEADHAYQHEMYRTAGNYEPEVSQRNADVRAERERDCDDWPFGVGIIR